MPSILYWFLRDFYAKLSWIDEKQVQPSVLYYTMVHYNTKVTHKITLNLLMKGVNCARNFGEGQRDGVLHKVKTIKKNIKLHVLICSFVWLPMQRPYFLVGPDSYWLKQEVSGFYRKMMQYCFEMYNLSNRGGIDSWHYCVTHMQTYQPDWQECIS